MAGSPLPMSEADGKRPEEIGIEATGGTEDDCDSSVGSSHDLPKSRRCPTPRPLARLGRWLLENHLLLGLALCFVMGLGAPDLGERAAAPQLDLGAAGCVGALKLLNITMQFLVSGLRMDTGAVLEALRSPLALGLALALILLITPCLGFAVLCLPIQPRQFVYGLLVFCCVPTTLTSGAAMVASCSGTERGAQLALMVVVASNVAGCFTAPLWLKLQLGGIAADVQIDQVKLLLNMLSLVLVPLILGKVLREVVPGAKAFASKHKRCLGLFANANLLCLVWQAVSASQRQLVAQPWANLVACAACGLGLHFAFWAVNAAAVVALPGAVVPDLHHRRAVFLLASQKTLPLSLALIAGLPNEAFNPGLVALPCIFGFLGQLVVDSLLVGRWARQRDDHADSTKEQQGRRKADERPPPIITVAITGHRTTREMAEHLPVLLEEQVEASAGAIACGASIVHLHVCEEDDSAVISTVAAERYHAVIRAIRARVPGAILEITCRGVDQGANLEEVVERGNLVMVDPAMWGHDPALRPEIVALNVSTRNVDERTVIVNPLCQVEQQIQRIYELGCVPRCDVYDVGDILVTKRLLDKGLLRAPVHYLLILGSFSGIGAGKRDLEAMVEQLPSGAIWTALGTGKHNFMVAEYSVELGGHLRTGFEDCTYVSKGVKARSNADLVKRLSQICGDRGTRPASLAEARQQLGLDFEDSIA